MGFFVCEWKTTKRWLTQGRSMADASWRGSRFSPERKQLEIPHHLMPVLFYEQSQIQFDMHGSHDLNVNPCEWVIVWRQKKREIRQVRTGRKSQKARRKPTDELVSVVEILAQILLAGIGGRQLLVEDAPRGDVVAREVRRHVEHSRNAKSVEFAQIRSVSSVTQIEKRKNLSRRVRIHVRRCCRVHHGALLTVAQVRITSLEFTMATYTTINRPLVIAEGKKVCVCV